MIQSSENLVMDGWIDGRTSGQKMAGISDTTANSDIFVDDVTNAIKAIKESKQRPNAKAIWQYLSNKLASLKITPLKY